jgi:hypothetical protein
MAAQGYLDVANPARTGDCPGLGVSLQAFTFSDPIPVRGLMDRWQGDFTPRNDKQQAYGQWGGGFSWSEGPWRVGIWDDSHLLFESSRDAATLLWLTKRKFEVPVGTTFKVWLTAKGIRRTGSSASRSWELWRSGEAWLSAGAGLRFWTATGLQIGRIEGTALATSPKQYDYNLQVDYSYNQNRLYDLTVPSPRGWGASADVGFVAGLSHWQMEAAVRDLGGTTRWTDLPMTLATARSNRYRVDENGFRNPQPTIEGWEELRTTHQNESPAWMSTLAWRPTNGCQATCRFERVASLSLLDLEGAIPITSNLVSTFSHEFRTGLWAAGLRFPRGRFRIGSTSIRYEQAHALFLEMGYSHLW